MPTILLDAFWIATCGAAGLFTAPLELFVYLLSLLLSWTGTRRSKGETHLPPGH
jgi:hypothetical protein